MASNAQKTHFARTQNEFAERKARDAIQLLGKALPASVVAVVSSGIVTVKFELTTTFTLPQVTVPIGFFEYIRYPIQVGCKGEVFPSDAHLGAMSGLGSGVATLVKPANLAALTFFPVGNKNWSAAEDPNALIIYGESGGVIVRTKNSAVHVKITAAGIEFLGPAHFLNGVTIDGDLTTTGNVSLGGGAKKVVLDGDPVTGGVVHASSTKTKAT